MAWRPPLTAAAGVIESPQAIPEEHPAQGQDARYGPGKLRSQRQRGGALPLHPALAGRQAAQRGHGRARRSRVGLPRLRAAGSAAELRAPANLSATSQHRKQLSVREVAAGVHGGLADGNRDAAALTDAKAATNSRPKTRHTKHLNMLVGVHIRPYYFGVMRTDFGSNVFRPRGAG